MGYSFGEYPIPNDVARRDVIDSMGRNQVSNFVTEFGLHDVRVRGVTLQTPRY